MEYTGIIIEESLVNLDILRSLVIVRTKIEPVTDAHKTPWLTQWTMHQVVIPTEQIEEIAEILSESFLGHSWYTDFKDDHTHYVVFPGKVFRIDRGQPSQYKQAIDYGIALGIPEYQLDFSSSPTDQQQPQDQA